MYVKKSFVLSNEQLSSLQANFRVSFTDGYLLFLNGVEIARQLLGPTGYSVSAAQYAFSLAGNFTPFSFSVPTSMFLEGENVVSVQCHSFQDNFNSLFIQVRGFAFFVFRFEFPLSIRSFDRSSSMLTQIKRQR